MDAYMKNLKPIIFAAHSELKQSIPALKKNHLYEAFAAFCGFKSYAAYLVGASSAVESIELANRHCFERLQGLGFDAGESIQVCQQIEEAWQQFNSISLDDIYTYYMADCSGDTVSATVMLEALSPFIKANDLDAILVGLVITTQELIIYSENPDNKSGEYWYEKRLANFELNMLQSEVAERYHEILPYKELLKLVIEKLEQNRDLNIPSPLPLKAIVEQHSDDHKRSWSSYFSDNPDRVIEAVSYALYLHDADQPLIPFYLYLDWIKAEMIVSPSREKLISTIANTCPDAEKWLWHFVGLRSGIDVTQSNLRAINRYTGEDYDDYGPMEVVGDEGISLPPIPDDIKVKVKRSAAELIR